MKKKVFFEEINILNLVVAFILFPFFGKIIYRTSQILEKKNTLSIFIEKNFFFRIGFRNLDCKYNNLGFKTKELLIKRVYKNFLSKNFIFIKFLKKNNITSKQIEKIKICLWDEYNNNEIWWQIQTSSYILLKKQFLLNNVRILYFTQDLTSYLLLKQIKNKNLKIFGIIALISQLFFISNKLIQILNKKLKKIFTKKINIKKKDDKALFVNMEQASKYDFAFFPHANSFKFGKSFNKTFIYENDQNSLLYKKKVLTIWTVEPDQLSIRYLRKNKIPSLIMPHNFKKSNYLRFVIEFIKNIFFELIKPINLNISNISTLVLLITMFRKVDRSKNFFDSLTNLKAFFIDYDLMLPRVITFAADLSGKKSISYQERTTAYIWMPNLISNYYLINGKKFQEILENKKYQIDKYLTVGMHRSRYIKLSNSPKKEYERFKQIKSKYNLVLCLTIVRVNDFLVDIFGEDGTSTANEINFYRDLIKLAKKFKSHYFVIKPKEVFKQSYINDYPSDLINDLNNLPNIELCNNTLINSYELAYFADLTIGKQTTLMEEILAINKPIIYHDPENNFRTFGYPLAKLDIVAKDYSHLELLFSKFIKSKGVLDKDVRDFIDNFLTCKENINQEDLIVKNVKQILQKEIKEAF
mgnify:CR=1 FL=1|jgi:hypothetical protein|tara:strand:+ start:574 stop:2493 length:1920 start_codon:yes stop_codon:yes gene_type:complete